MTGPSPHTAVAPCCSSCGKRSIALVCDDEQQICFACISGARVRAARAASQPAQRVLKSATGDLFGDKR